MITRPVAGLKVRMTEDFKRRYAAQVDSIAEFGDCMGVLEDPMFTDTSAIWNVRWIPSGLRYGYALVHLEEA